MNATQNTYSTAGIRYSYQGHRWTFASEENKFTLVQQLRGGRLIAERVASQLKGALARTKGAGLDNLARAHIAKIVGTKTLSTKGGFPDEFNHKEVI